MDDTIKKPSMYLMLYSIGIKTIDYPMVKQNLNKLNKELKNKKGRMVLLECGTSSMLDKHVAQFAREKGVQRIILLGKDKKEKLIKKATHCLLFTPKPTLPEELKGKEVIVVKTKTTRSLFD